MSEPIPQVRILTLRETAERMRKHGCRITAELIADGIEQGIFPFGRLVKRENKKARKFVILESDFEKWIESNDGMHVQPNINTQSSVTPKLERDIKEVDHFCPFLSVAQREKVVCDASCALYIPKPGGDGGTCSIAILAKKTKT